MDFVPQYPNFKLPEGIDFDDEDYKLLFPKPKKAFAAKPARPQNDAPPETNARTPWWGSFCLKTPNAPFPDKQLVPSGKPPVEPEKKHDSIEQPKTKPAGDPDSSPVPFKEQVGRGCTFFFMHILAFSFAITLGWYHIAFNRHDEIMERKESRIEMQRYEDHRDSHQLDWLKIQFMETNHELSPVVKFCNAPADLYVQERAYRTDSCALYHRWEKNNEIGIREPTPVELQRHYEDVFVVKNLDGLVNETNDLVRRAIGEGFFPLLRALFVGPKYELYDMEFARIRFTLPNVTPTQLWSRLFWTFLFCWGLTAMGLTFIVYFWGWQRLLRVRFDYTFTTGVFMMLFSYGTYFWMFASQYCSRS
jgi:hypothetical protein